MRRPRRTVRPARNDWLSQLVAIVFLALILTIVLMLRTTIADNISALFGTLGGETSDLSLQGDTPPTGETTGEMGRNGHPGR